MFTSYCVYTTVANIKHKDENNVNHTYNAAKLEKWCGMRV